MSPVANLAAITQSGTEAMTWTLMQEFVNSRCLVLVDNANISRLSLDKDTRKSEPRSSPAHTARPESRRKECQPSGQNRNIYCRYCSTTEHSIFDCPVLEPLSVLDRREKINGSGRCFNCLSDKHKKKDCPSTRKCGKCKQKHHTILHHEAGQQQSSTQATHVQANHAANGMSNGIKLTDQVKLEGSDGRLYPYRAFLDTGLPVNFTSERAVKFLKLEREPVRLTLSGTGGVPAGHIKHMVEITLHSKVNRDFCLAVPAYVQGTVTKGNMPAERLNTNNWKHLDGLRLADPNYDKPEAVD